MFLVDVAVRVDGSAVPHTVGVQYLIGVVGPPRYRCTVPHKCIKSA